MSTDFELMLLLTISMVGGIQTAHIFWSCFRKG